MKQKWTYLSLVLGAVLVFGFTFWFGLAPKQNLVKTSILESAPDYFLEGVEAKTFDENGQLIEKVLASEVKHFPVPGESRLQRPIITKIQNSNHWTASSETGLIKDEDRDIIFTGSAKIVSQADQEPTTTITSNTIIYADKEQSITSIGNATVISEQGNVKADTITAFTHSNKVTMQGSVRGSYEQNR